MFATHSRTLLTLLALVIVVGIATAPQPIRAAGPWYVVTGGSDSNDCLSPLTACATMNAAIGKASSGDTIYVATGTYTNTVGIQVVSVSKSVILSGGWAQDFASRTGETTIDGDDAQRGITISSGITATIEHFTIENGYADVGSVGGGILNDGTLSINDCAINNNQASSEGGGIHNRGILTITHSTIQSNTAAIAYGGGIRNSGQLVINDSAILGNYAYNSGGGIDQYDGSLTLNNTTVSGNSGWSGGGIQMWNGTLSLNNVTISHNTARSGSGGGLTINDGTSALKNTLIAENASPGAEDCYGTITSAGYNLLGSQSGCTWVAGTGDLLDTAPKLVPLSDALGFVPLYADSPAVDAGNPAGCTDGGGAVLTHDQRGVARAGRCDIGAYEHVTPGPAAQFLPMAGSHQVAPPLTVFGSELQAGVLDAQGTPIQSLGVTFSAPESGASAVFSETGTISLTVTSDAGGLAATGVFTANDTTGTYTVTASIPGMTTTVGFVLTNAQWYVAPGGSDDNDCWSPSTPCATPGAAVAKAVSGGTVYLATGVYTGTGSEVVLLDKDITLLGGWNTEFTTQQGFSTLDGQATRRVITVDADTAATIERLIIQNGRASIGGGISITTNATLVMTHSWVRDNQSTGNGGGIYVSGTDGTAENKAKALRMIGSAITGNTGSNGGGIYVNAYHTTATLINVTIAENHGFNGGGVSLYNHAILKANNTTIAKNTVHNSGGAINVSSGSGTISNSLVSGGVTDHNHGLTWDEYSITGWYGTPGPLEGTPPYIPLLAGDPAINGGNPAGCTDGDGQLLTADQRGSPRVGLCDVGAYEASWEMSKEVRGHLHPGGTADYTIIVSNVAGGGTVINDITAVDTLPDTLTYSPGSLGATSGTAIAAGQTITWTGSVSDQVSITFSTLISDTTANQIITNTAIGEWSGFETEASVNFLSIHKTFLPFCMSHYCPDFFDDFSNPASGWPVGEDSYVRTEYKSGEYRVISKQAGYIYLFRAPTCTRENYAVSVNARWYETPGNSYGILFGITDDFSYYYLFDMNTEYQMFRLYRRSPSGFTQIVAPTYSGAINEDTSANYIKAIRIGNSITLKVNGTGLGTWSDSAISGLTGVGLVSSPYSDSPTSDARFDNFSVVSIEDGAMTQVPNQAGAKSPKLDIAAPPLESDFTTMGWYATESVDTDWLPAQDGRTDLPLEAIAPSMLFCVTALSFVGSYCAVGAHVTPKRANEH